MKSRRVTVTLEIETDVTLWRLRSAKVWNATLSLLRGTRKAPTGELHVLQAQANVIRQGKKNP